MSLNFQILWSKWPTSSKRLHRGAQMVI